MKINPFFLVTMLILVATLVTMEVYIQNVNAQNSSDLDTPVPADVTIPGIEKIQVSIVPGATFLTDTAYDPNPIEVNVGQTILWTNDDFSFHTVTSGVVGDTNSVRIFDSGLAGPTALASTGKTYEYTFESAGEYPYYCILHPGMVGKVIVT
ncbi:cupredoxin domain-containing protein [Candidatus Nitrosocosmicus arcticus]|uniref:Blue (Type 1) copper domain protein n=1 Tax=Candidatus Nitrosocosmicus arcticus TaxID=2035267 RepID=A0A557SWX2_9ARCH|nr:plastocyanin/azurin family copper-binding protein [Candidatus Nitrosocosmicus arcticus]TVP41106.1 blue (type 1) copper domain protein [Candidatus Nitrosocosmicus arcticus]